MRGSMLQGIDLMTISKCVFDGHNKDFHAHCGALLPSVLHVAHYENWYSERLDGVAHSVCFTCTYKHKHPIPFRQKHFAPFRLIIEFTAAFAVKVLESHCGDRW